MKKLIALLFAGLVILSACGDSAAIPTFEEIASEATDIIRAILSVNQAGASADTVLISVQGSYKGSLRYRDIVEVQLPDYSLDIFGSGRFYLLFFLNTAENEVAELAYANHSVFFMDMDDYRGGPNITFTNASINGSPGFAIEYSDLRAFWHNHMQELYDTYNALDFYARLERRGVINLWHSLPEYVEPIEYPLALTAMDELIAHKEFYLTRAGRRDEADPFVMSTIESNFGRYSEGFFADNYLVLFTFSAHSGSVGFGVDAIFANGDIYVTQHDIWPGHAGTADYLQVLAILEVSRDVIIDEFNVIINNRW